MHVVAQRIELKTNKKFWEYCRNAFGVARFAYNYGLGRFKEDYIKYKAQMAEYDRQLKEYKASPTNTAAPVKPKLPTVFDYKKDFNAIRKEQYPFTCKVTKYASQQPFINLGKSITNYFKQSKERRKKGNKAAKANAKKNFPKFKKKSYNKGSFYIGGDQVVIKTGVSCSRQIENQSQRQYLNIPRFGYVQLREKLRFEGHINSVTISQRGDRIFASFSINIDDEEFKRTHKPIEHSAASVGIDLGLKSALILSDGIGIEAPKPLKNNLRKLKRLQRQLSRKQHPKTKDDKTKVSANYKKFSRRVNKLYWKIRNIRDDFIHKVTTALIRNYEYIALEDLNVKGMMANKHLSRAISDIGFYKIKEVLKYKALDFNRKIIEADRFYPSSKTCSRCGSIKDSLTLKDRVYECPNCGLHIDRDLNAAINLREQIKKIGGATSEFTPVKLKVLQDCLKQNSLAYISVKAGIW